MLIDLLESSKAIGLCPMGILRNYAPLNCSLEHTQYCLCNKDTMAITALCNADASLSHQKFAADDIFQILSLPNKNSQHKIVNIF